MQFASILTDRLILRQWREDDLAPFAALNADAEVMAYFPQALDRPRSDEMVQRCASLIKERGWGFWAVEDRLSHAFIGFVGLHVPSHDLPFMPCVEIGWRLSRAYWGKSYAFEAAKAALNIGFGALGLDEIVAFTTLKNTRSRALMERLGMQQDAETFDHPSVLHILSLRVHVLYRLRREDWVQQAWATPQPG
ncbi:GNAT family N-acetyltransferase [Methylobacillus arboreus]|uniref:GNAT family N-acetyltransferase n=1 Tax=Methylobacillus arboreus TaxID=755170 RepID=UPI001E4EF7FA|nr:GNAT family N-acetyltransferase [Methylobacillus arboreus]MCB5189315.1 GNAT family N-acetyltransferase [Methylobacillus arboreus]